MLAKRLILGQSQEPIPDRSSSPMLDASLPRPETRDRRRTGVRPLTLPRLEPSVFDGPPRGRIGAIETLISAQVNGVSRGTSGRPGICP